ncbi:MAG TPA: Na+/H+ antiporter NhaC family protein, partial [Fimbriimonadaceae bacterium]|nr:Na+/H+ antiporter NhaC family protein [Fimbriimonadaceae bacterium]
MPLAGIVSLFVTALLALLVLLPGDAQAQERSGEFSLEAPELVLRGVPFSVNVTADGSPPDEARLRVAGENFEVNFSKGAATVEDVVVQKTGGASIALAAGGEELARTSTKIIFGWLSILPPLLAIGIALVFRQVIPALFIGIYVGAATTYGLSLSGLWYGLLDTINVYVMEAIAPPDGSTDHASIIVFTLMIGGMVGIISRNGGMKGVVNKVIGFASTPKRGQFATGVLGIAIFFDDYANTLVVGNTMRAITDRLNVSREKLAYIVDSTAAPVATIALISTWIGFQVGLIDEAVGGIAGLNQSAYNIFLNSIPYAFYPILAIAFVFAVALTGRDFGPMYKAEQRSRNKGKVLREGANVDSATAGSEEMEPKQDKPERAFNAVVPIVVLLGTALVALYVTGSGDTIQDIIGSADPFSALVWGSLLAALVAVILSIGQRILSLGETMDAWYTGLRAMLFVLIILVMAWALAAVTGVLHTGDYLVSVLGESLPPALVPALIFVVAAATAFSTGTSWGTMGILVPLAVPLTWAILQANGMTGPENYHLLYASTMSVLAGAVWGDHCSPISDTTIISSMASGCDHIDHVRTQIPYALF